MKSQRSDQSRKHLYILDKETINLKDCKEKRVWARDNMCKEVTRKIWINLTRFIVQMSLLSYQSLVIMSSFLLKQGGTFDMGV